jgi:hypothetical protein
LPQALDARLPRHHANVEDSDLCPGSCPGGPSHQAIDDVALMRALPNMVVLDLADANEIAQAVQIAADHRGPVYLRLKRGEIPVIFEPKSQAVARSCSCPQYRWRRVSYRARNDGARHNRRCADARRERYRSLSGECSDSRFSHLDLFTEVIQQLPEIS